MLPSSMLVVSSCSNPLDLPAYFLYDEEEIHLVDRDGNARDELLNREMLNTLTGAKVLKDQWRREYKQFRPHSVIHYRPPAPEAILVAALD